MQVTVFFPTIYYLSLDTHSELGRIPRQRHRMHLETVEQKAHLSASSQNNYLHKEVPICIQDRGLHVCI